MKLTLLGTGTSCGVPMIGCHCPVCTSNDPHDRRLRCSMLLESRDTCILFDCSPDFREQMLRIGFEKRINACFITHEHYDHVGGIDDLRPFSYIHDLDVYADPFAAGNLEQRLPYCLLRNVYPGVPQLKLHRIRPHETVQVGELSVQAIDIMHGKLPIFGYRIGPVAYITDMTSMPDSEWELLQGLEVLIINGLRHTSHPTHQSIEQAVELARRLHVPTTRIIHMSHEAGLHEETNANLPEGIRLAYDGEILNIED